MSLVADSEHAVDCLDRLQARLWEKGDHSQDQDLASIMVMLDTPLFKQLLTLQDSLQELKQVSEIHPLTEDNFMFGPSGELVLPTGEENGYPSQELSESGTLNLRQVYTGPGSAISTYSYNIEFQRAIDKAATGREVETIKLFKPENSSLGFSVVGLKREEQGELGIYVQDINPGGIAAKDGRLREGDQILAIDGQPLDISHTEAIRILQNAQGLVEIVVARGPISGESEQVTGEEEVNVDGEEPIEKAEDRQEEALPPTGLDKSSDMVLSTEWTQIEVIDLINDGTGLGFGIIGGRSTGVVVKTILPGGVADVDTRLRSGDHILQIGEVNVRGMGSEQVALVLRQSGSHVRLIVARSVMEPPPFQIPHAPVVPTHLLDDHLDQINAIMAMDSQENLDMRMQEEQSISNIMAGQVQVHPQPYDMNEVPEVEIFDVDLTKDNHGLGITIAGYVGGDNTPDEVSGIFVKGIADGSAAAVDGRVQVNDQIIEVDGLSLQGYSNHQAVEVLRKTGQLVHLKLVRYRHGPKYEKLQQYLAQANATLMGQPGLISQNHESLAASNPTYDITTPNPHVDYNDVNFMSDEDYSGELLPDVEAAIKACWEPLIGSDFEVVVAQLSKFKEGGGLGISLEGTVDVENGVEVRPHHYIRSILPDGPVGLNGHLISADELLEVNGKRLLGLNHVEVVNILKDLPQHVRLVCARRKSQTTETYAHKDAQFLSSVFNTGVHTNFPASERLVKAKSEMALSSTDTAVLNSLNKSKSRSLEPLTNLAMWSSEPVVIELLKEDKGLGFSILDYQDPVNPNETVIVIRSLVPKGVAQLDGRLVPGDRLIFVNDTNVEHATLDEAVQALKGAGKGVVRIGVAKPLPLADNFRGDNQDDGPPPPLPITSPPTAAPPHTETPAYELESRLSPRVVVAHRKSESADSEVSSSSDLLTSSDLKGVSSPPSTPRSTASPGMSPLASPSLTRGWRTASTDAIPTTYEKNIKVQKGNDQLGMTVDAVDRGINGCVIKTIAEGGALAKDGRLVVGDYVVLVNNESMRRITNAQARAILRRASLLNRSISFTYIPSADVAAYQETLTNRSLECSPSHKPSMPSPRRTLSAVSPPSSPSPAPASPTEVVPVQLSTVQQMSPRQKSLASDGSPAAGNHAWGPARTVELVREPGRSLGISIVGGRVDLFHVSEEHTITGIFIKHVVENSPAGRNGTLKTGDRILEVNGVDVRDATHDEAVEIIRNATSPVTFVVQSLSDSACPGDLEAAELKSVQSFEEATAQSTAPLQAKPKDRLTHLRSESRGESVSDSESEDEFGYTTKKLQKKYGELSGDIHLVDLSTGSNGLGLSLAGNKDRNLMSAFVAGIQPESTAAKDGRITVGDELLEVNGQVLHGRSHLNASAIIKGIKTASVKIVLLRRENYQHHMAIKPLRLGPVIHTEEHVESATSPKPTPNRAPVPAATGTTPHKEPPKEENKSLDIVNTVTLQKGPQGLGFGIVEETRDGRHGIYVRSVTPGGAAAKDGQLTVGDQILEVGDKSLNGVHYDKAIDILRQSQGSVKLMVRKIGKGKQGESIKLGNTVDESSTDPPPPVVTTDPKTCPIIPGRETLIEIEKGRTGLGLSIVGGSDTLLGAIIIHEVYEDGAAFKDGRLSAGDQILEVNREDLRDATHDHAIQVLRQTPSSVWILMYRDDNQLKEEDIYDIFSVELMKKPGKGLGLSIVGKKTDVGVYISDIVKGGVAEADGRLMQGDQILAVNGEDMRNSTQEYAAGVLKTLMGKVTMMVGRLKAGSRTSSRRNSNSPGSALKKSESSASNRSRGKHSKNVSVDWTHLRNVDLQHDESGSLGLSIAGGVGSPLGDVPIIVANLTPTGPAARCGRLRVGDKILMINNRSTDGMTHDEAVAVLKSTTPVMLQVIQGEELAVSVNGSRSRQVSTDMSNDPTATELSVPPPEEGQGPQCNTLILERGQEGLGFSIVGGHGSPHGDLPIYVKNVFEKGAAAENGGLKRGDQILAVNGKSLDGLTHDEAVNILKNARGKVTLSVLS